MSKEFRQSLISSHFTVLLPFHYFTSLKPSSLLGTIYLTLDPTNSALNYSVKAPRLTQRLSIVPIALIS